MKVLLIFIVFISSKAFSQDSTILTNISLQARIIEYLAPMVANPSDDSVFNIFLKWRTSFRATKPVGTTMVTTDTIPTQLLASLYSYTISNSEGLKVGAMMKTQISSARSTNQYFDRLCTDIEDQYNGRFVLLRNAGRKLLLGK